MLWLQAIFGFLGGPISREIRGALRDRQNAANEAERIAADQRIAALEAAQEIASIEAADRWSATRLGRWLIVVPWGLHWAAVYAVSIINPNFGTEWVVLAVPDNFNNMAMVLIPAIVIADAGALTVRRLKK